MYKQLFISKTHLLYIDFPFNKSKKEKKTANSNLTQSAVHSIVTTVN